MTGIRLLIFALALALTAVSLTTCESPKRAPKQVDYTRSDVACVRDTALAIAASGRPYPNILRTKDFAVLERDVWIGSNLFRISNSRHPGYSIHNPGFLPDEHPLSGIVLTGGVESALGIPRQVFADPDVGGTLQGILRCTSDYPANWYNLTAPTRNELLANVLAQMRGKSKRPELIHLQEIPAIGMTAVGTVIDGKLVGTTYYLPYEPLMTHSLDHGPSVLQGIICRGEYNPSAKLELHRFCEASVLLSSTTFLQFQVYQQYLPFIPKLHAVLKTRLLSSQLK